MTTYNKDSDKNQQSNRGFAQVGKERQHEIEIASKGDQAAHKKGTVHEFSAKEGRKLGTMVGNPQEINVNL